MGQTRIEWATHVWNPVTGCNPISEGCRNCYAERFARRLAGRYGYPKVDPFRVTLHPERVEEPLRWRKPRRVFVCSMGDLFHDNVPDEYIDRVFAAMATAKQHTFLLVTKRPKRMKNYLTDQCRRGEIARWFSTGAIYRAQVVASGYEKRIPWPLPNVWLGVTAENQDRADERIPVLLQIPAAVRFVSVEPMLGPVDLTRIPCPNGCDPETYCVRCCHDYNQNDWGTVNSFEEGISWVIAGGETGPKARPCHPDWVRSLRDQCQSAGVPFFLKQMHIGGNLVKMPELDGRRWDELPSF
ncbi:MAG: phage Gp37/Gp68 family protein [Thermoanaerobacter sp.]|nr:phage Gp37/Gp68 family protein [Thermoanaerobacter sp.]